MRAVPEHPYTPGAQRFRNEIGTNEAHRPVPSPLVEGVPTISYPIGISEFGPGRPPLSISLQL